MIVTCAYCGLEFAHLGDFMDHAAARHAVTACLARHQPGPKCIECGTTGGQYQNEDDPFPIRSPGGRCEACWQAWRKKHQPRRTTPPRKNTYPGRVSKHRP